MRCSRPCTGRVSAMSVLRTKTCFSPLDLSRVGRHVLGRPLRLGPRLEPSVQLERGARAAVAPLSLDGPAAQSTSAEPDDWEVLGRRSGTNQIVLRKMRKRRHEGAGERERKLLRAAVFANVSSN